MARRLRGRKNRRSFSHSARRVNALNLGARLFRGGYRL
ncbi:hypothetical protein [Sigmofec virus UA08Rod_6403]|uniref:Uncharacterized protein n=1 Tax=Sigmofec virus UA08Rod_6403 TaxID=2929228 RepID=A0A976R6U0_9VIRU|nr:hypothetical protein [Sigmofec virus UA08Rod_6403]